MTMSNKETKLLPVPEVGQEYHFWDDGKSSPSRHYICKCERVIKYKDAKDIKFTLRSYKAPYTKDSEYTEYEATLKEIWKKAVKDHPWVFTEDTDYFVEISCPKYDENRLWAARAKWGGWFTLSIQSFWQGGVIDVTGEKYNDTVEYWENEGEYEFAQEYKDETY